MFSLRNVPGDSEVYETGKGVVPGLRLCHWGPRTVEESVSDRNAQKGTTTQKLVYGKSDSEWDSDGLNFKVGGMRDRGDGLKRRFINS